MASGTYFPAFSQSFFFVSGSQLLEDAANSSNNKKLKLHYVIFSRRELTI
jgi:hypothetical protein